MALEYLSFQASIWTSQAKKMRLRSVLILILLCGSEALKYFRSDRITGLCHVLEVYIHNLKKLNEEIVIVFDKMSNRQVIDFVSVFIAKDPHQIASYSDTNRLILNKTAIVLLSSVA